MVKRKQFVEFYLIGKFFSTQKIVEEVTTHDFEKIGVPENSIAYRFVNKYEVLLDKEIYEVVATSNIMYFGECYTIEEFAEKFPESSGLIALFERKGWKCVTQPRKGVWGPAELFN